MSLTCRSQKRKKAKVDEANSLLEQASGYLQLFSDLSATEKDKIFSNFSIELVMFVHGKKCPGRPVYKNIDEVKSAFMKKIVSSAGLENAMSSGTMLLWSILEDQPAAPAATAPRGRLVDTGLTLL